MDKVSVMAAYSGRCVWFTVYGGTAYEVAAFIYGELHTRSEYAAITPTLTISTDTIESFLQFLAKHCTSFPDDGSFVFPNHVGALLNIL